jgi:hypothetical protein
MRHLTFNICKNIGIAAFLSLILMAGVASGGSNAGMAGAFLRMGLGARALAMGDVGVALPGSGYGIYYNAASLAHLQKLTAMASYSQLALGRRLNFVGFAAPLHPASVRPGESLSAGLGVGWINSGAGTLDGYDSDGNPSGTFSQSENAFYFSFALRLMDKVSLGFSPTILYNTFPKLTPSESLSSTTLGFDAGILVNPWRDLYLGAQARHINAKYRWDTGTLLGQSGTVTEDHFPRIYRLGASYDFPFGLLVAGDFETSDQQDSKMHLGAEYTLPNVSPYSLSLRGGYDDQDYAMGLGFGFNLWKVRGQLDYAYQIQSVPPWNSQVVSFGVNF